MKNLTLNDQTQEAVLPHLQGTEILLARAASAVSGKDRGAEIVAMPDLGMAHNVARMLGGFYTGALYHWDADRSMVPVDATVNSCGVSMFRLADDIPNKKEFDHLLGRAILKASESSYQWNFNSGNHFVIYGEVKGSPVVPDGRYAVLHSSAAEFKKQHNGLYPTVGNWYAEDIRTLEDPQTGRRIRYIQDGTADRFIQTAQMLEGFNRSRHRYFAELIFGARNILEEVSNEQHYGMPTRDSVAIGCQWTRDKLLLLLTAPEKPIFLVKPETGAKNDVHLGGRGLLLYPHGLGKRSTGSLSIGYASDALELNGKAFGAEASIGKDPNFPLRDFDISETIGGRVPSIVNDILRRCPAAIQGVLHQVFSYHAKSPLSV